MNAFARSLGAGLVLLALLVTMRQSLGEGVFRLALGLSSLWFVIAFILLTRPPNVNEEVLRKGFEDTTLKPRRRNGVPMTIPNRLLLSFSVANALCLLLWVSLIVFRR